MRLVLGFDGVRLRLGPIRECNLGTSIMKMASKVSSFTGIFRASAWIAFVFFALSFNRLRPYESMSKLMVSALLFFENWENLPASAPTSIITFASDGSMELRMKLVSICVRYLPMRVFAAFSQWVSSELLSSKTASLQNSILRVLLQRRWVEVRVSCCILDIARCTGK